MSNVDSRRRSGLPNATRKQAIDTESKQTATIDIYDERIKIPQMKEIRS